MWCAPTLTLSLVKSSYWIETANVEGYMCYKLFDRFFFIFRTDGFKISLDYTRACFRYDHGCDITQWVIPCPDSTVARITLF